ncbi:hypothetical protein SAMN04489806_1192 [Paramicrobacterium humi]|uniref:Pyrroline-5-carboxylate reductase catalytic N-terminal domain-containing protein n=1 Tax=Paramicrobacterium humi TaxID=640635 RepID=A0A1H4KKJ5_9MICO|nr:NADPH-dependent F420 reductase [Microbacterium humi]SEB58618.1 hypothetical protein SAMN04489806_1192 [Microbacterium humi]
MTDITIIGAGNMGSALAGRFSSAGNSVQVLARDAAKANAAGGTAAGTIGDAITGSIVILAVPYPALGEIFTAYADALAGKIVVDMTNPVNGETFDGLDVPADASAAAEIAAKLPSASVLKAFNTNFAATLATGDVAGTPTTVLVAGDDADAKSALTDLIASSGLRALDAGSLKRARELEALGFLQILLAAGEKTSWTSGFALAK